MKKYIIFLLIVSLLFSCQLDKDQLGTSFVAARHSTYSFWVLTII